SLEAREVETLFAVIRRLKAQGIAIVYVSHRLDELFAICDRATIMRDGRVVHVGDIADLDRLRMISLMLGRDMAEARRHGAAASPGPDPPAPGPPVLSPPPLPRRHDLAGVDVEIRPGEVVGLGGLLGSGRSETAKAIAGALKLDSGEVTVLGKPVRR